MGYYDIFPGFWQVSCCAAKTAGRIGVATGSETLESGDSDRLIDLRDKARVEIADLFDKSPSVRDSHLLTKHN